MSKEAFISIMLIVAALFAFTLASILLYGLYNVMTHDHSIVKYELGNSFNDKWIIKCVREWDNDSSIDLEKHLYTLEEVIAKVDELNEQLKRQPDKEILETVESQEK